MTKGTTSQGPKNDKTHCLCRRCNRRSFHRQHKRCASCGYPDAKTRKYTGWAGKVRRRRGEGTGRMRHMKDVPQKAKNGFRTQSNFTKALPERTVAKPGVKAKIPRRKLK